MRWEKLRKSQNVEDRRPKPDTRLSWASLDMPPVRTPGPPPADAISSQPGLPSPGSLATPGPPAPYWLPENSFGLTHGGDAVTWQMIAKAVRRQPVYWNELTRLNDEVGRTTGSAWDLEAMAADPKDWF